MVAIIVMLPSVTINRFLFHSTYHFISVFSLGNALSNICFLEVLHNSNVVRCAYLDYLVFRGNAASNYPSQV